MQVRARRSTYSRAFPKASPPPPPLISFLTRLAPLLLAPPSFASQQDWDEWGISSTVSTITTVVNNLTAGEGDVTGKSPASKWKAAASGGASSGGTPNKVRLPPHLAFVFFLVFLEGPTQLTVRYILPFLACPYSPLLQFSVENLVGAGVSQGMDAINVVGRAAMFLGTAIDNAIEVRRASTHNPPRNTKKKPTAVYLFVLRRARRTQLADDALTPLA